MERLVNVKKNYLLYRITELYTLTLMYYIIVNRISINDRQSYLRCKYNKYNDSVGENPSQGDRAYNIIISLGVNNSSFDQCHN